MTPVYLNPGPSSGSFPKEDHHLQLFLSPPNHHLSSSSTSSSSSVTTARDPRASVLLLGEPKQHHDHPPKGLQFYERSSGDYQPPIYSSPFQPAISGAKNDGCKFESSEIRSEDWEGSCGVKWMPSKMRLMEKMMSSTGSSTKAKADDDDDKPMKFTLKLQDQLYHVNEISSSSFSSNQTHNTATVIRVCSDCNTTTTPLWRSGPRGPKSLCNACGIRQRKARRAAAAAATVAGNGTVEASSSSKTNHKLPAHKEKKPRSSHNIGQSKKSCNKPPQNTKFCFKKIALSLSNNSACQGAFSRDVEEAAILLMELSCGFIPS